MRRGALAIVVIGSLLFPAIASAHLPTLWTGFKVKHSFAVRPAEISYTGDSTGFLGGFDGTGTYPNYGSLSWSSWTHGSATASGAVWINDCNPDCAGGTFSPAAVTVTAFKAKQRHFRRLTIQYTYQGTAYTDRRVLRPGFSRGSWFWNIPIHAR
jgi:hypothetical protein